MEQCRTFIWKWMSALLSALLVLGVLTAFSACGMKDDGTWMKCHGAQTAVAKLGGAMTVLFLLAAVLRNKALKTTLFGLGIVGSVVVFLIPETILPMCMMRTMRCYTVMQPFVRIMAVLIAASGVIAGPQALRQNNQERRAS